MKNHKRIAGDGESNLPQEMIQHIQHFLNGKEAARTTLLSKLWRSAWLTRPNLNFAQQHYQGRHQEQFVDLVEKTMQRYELLRLKIESLRLESYELSLGVNELLIVEAMKLGAVDLDINLGKQSSFVLPDQVLRSQTLTKLSLKGTFTVDLERLTCSKLKCLRLSDVNVDVNGDLFTDFPFLKKLVIRDCLGLRNIRICSESLELIEIRRCFFLSNENRNSWNTEFDVPNIRKIRFEGYGWPRLVFKMQTTCTKWEFDLRVKYLYNPTPEWFISLNKVLNQLINARVCLSIFPNFPKNDCSGVVGAAGLPTPLPAVEKLMLEGCLEVTAAFLDNLFLICRPKLIVRRCSEPIVPSDRKNKILLELSKRVAVEETTVEAGVVRFHLGWNMRQGNHPVASNRHMMTKFKNNLGKYLTTFFPPTQS